MEFGFTKLNVGVVVVELHTTYVTHCEIVHNIILHVLILSFLKMIS